MMNHRPDDDKLRREIVGNSTEHQFLAAGAGAGKTRTLVDHYFHLLDQGLKPAQLVAVTFTDKAAAEMKQRLREQCGAQARALRRQGEAEATRLWEERLHELELAPISTIHSFCTRVLRENALAADLDPDFTVLDEPRSQLLLKETVQQTLLERLGSADSARTLVVALGYEQAVGQLRDTVSKRALLHEVLQRPEYADSEALLARWARDLAEAQADRVREIIAHPDFHASARQVFACQGPAGDKLEVVRAAVAELCETGGVATWEETLPGSARQAAAIGTLLALSKLPSPGNLGRKGDWEKQGLDVAAVRGWVGFFCGNQSPVKASLDALVELQGDPAQDERCARLTCALVVETQAAIAAYAQAKQAQATLDFEDLLEKVRDLWVQAPEALARARQNLRHLMIDEFQDTNTLQKQVLWPLVTGRAEDSADAASGDLATDGPRLFIVGDAKQSIYRFRNAEVTVFNRSGQELAAAGCRYDELTRNFRSTAPLIEVFNRLFGDPAIMGPEAKADYEASYRAMQAHRGGPEQAQSPALVHLLKTRKVTEESEEEAEEPLSVREQEARWIAGHVLRLLAGEGAKVSRNGVWQPPRPGDIAILFRAMTDVQLYERALREVGLPYYLVVGRGFFLAQEIQDVIGALRVLENRLEGVALVGVLRSPLFGISDATLYQMAQGRAESWRERLSAAAAGSPALAAEQAERIVFADRTLTELEARKDRLTLSALVQELLDRTGLTAVLASQFGGMQMVSNLRKLVEVAGAFQIGRQLEGQGGLRDFIEYLKQMQTEEVREGQAPIEEEAGNSIKLMTVHAAKGLQWPIVILPDLARKAPVDNDAYRWHPERGIVVRETKMLEEGGAKTYWPPVGRALKARREAEDEAERRRLLYVAMTRAQDLLILSGAVPLKKEGGVSEIARKSYLGWLNEANPQSLWAAEENETGEALFEWDGETWVPAADLRISEGQWELVTSAETPPPAPELPAVLTQLAPLPADDRGQRRFTATELSVYAHCPRQYEAQLRLGMPGQTPGFGEEGGEGLTAAEFGTVVHQVLQLVGSQGELGLQRLLTEEEGLLRLDTRLDSRAAKVKEQIRERVLGFVRSPLYRETVADAKRLRSEMLVATRLVVEGVPVIVEGVVDALAEDVQGNLHLLDYKTGAEETAKHEQYRLQLGLYCYAVQQATGQLPAGAHLIYLGAGGMEAKALDLPRDQDEAVAAAQAAVRGLWAGEFEREAHDCGWCRVLWCERRQKP